MRDRETIVLKFDQAAFEKTLADALEAFKPKLRKVLIDAVEEFFDDIPEEAFLVEEAAK
ncbi:hypothetical protein [Phyllobacterium zundukense]|uniref:hypothetical protein n=1 Tax=Phyllobacterium zundukense TaxID=1867719 RepID=UPI0012FFE599|nr:hypothetical protein [Phyllobacterium zundukense]